MKNTLLVLLFAVCSQLTLGQTRKPKPAVKDSMSSEAFIQMVDQTLLDFYTTYANTRHFDSIIDALEYEPHEVPDFSDEVYCERLQKMNEYSSFQFDCNPITLSTIRFFAKNRRSFAKIVLGRSALYFDMYEELLDKHGIPHELRFLSVIESGLRPQVKSPAGALGLWQFMYGTGKMYGLKENSYLDERMDPLKSTDAACRYLKKLYDIYGDWNLALAAYNAGPGNVNKAIRRSGGKTTYWQVRPFLPRETQGYVPNFIAAAYLLTYHAEHNIVPMEAKLHYTQLDTMCLKQGVHMQTIEKLVAWEIADIQTVNPVYKKTYIPQTNPPQCITGPLPKIGKLVSLEDSLYKLEKVLYAVLATPDPKPGTNATPAPSDSTEAQNPPPVADQEKIIYHKVRSGETMTKIARKYGVSNGQIMQWNRLRSTRVNVGKVLKIVVKPATTEITNAPKEPVAVSAPVKKDTLIAGMISYDTVVKITHTVARNESLTYIANKYNVTVEEIKKWNALTTNWLNIDQKLVIQQRVKLSKPGLVAAPKKVETPKPVEPKPAPAPVKKFYTVKSGDLFNRIAQKHGLTITQLQKLNPAVNPDRIREGQQLRVK